MFDNVGGKIKGITKAVCWIGIILFLCFGLLLIIKGSKLSYYSRTEELGNVVFIIGWAILIIGPILIWLFSLGFYAFGQLVENSDIQTEIMREEQKGRKKYEERQSEAGSAAMHEVTPQPVASPAPLNSRTPFSLQEAVSKQQSSHQHASDAAVIPISLDPDHERCPKCSTVQRSGRIKCWGCGATFIRESGLKE